MAGTATPLSEYMEVLRESAGQKGIVKIDGNMPSFGLSNSKDIFDTSKWKVRILKVDLDDPEQLLQLEDIETKSIRSEGILVVSTDKFTFMDKMFIVLRYMEQLPPIAKESTPVSKI